MGGDSGVKAVGRIEPNTRESQVDSNVTLEPRKEVTRSTTWNDS